MSILSRLEEMVRAAVRLSGARRDRLAYVTLVVALQGLLMILLLSISHWLLLRDHVAASAVAVFAGSMGLSALGHLLLRRTLFKKLLSLKLGLNEAERSRSLAEDTVREKTRLVATVSHEIRTPLNGVTGMLGLLLETGLTPEQRNYATMAHGSGRTLLSFVDEVLDGAKAEALDSGLDRDIDLVALVENVTELLSPRAQAKGIDIACRIDPNLPQTIRGSDTRLRQLLFNLAGNAIKFTEKGGVHVGALRGPDNALVLQVRDTGIGMTSEEVAKLFTAFTQANDDTQRQFGGTGLGLFISKDIVTAMGGTLSVTSKPGEGTAFTAVLPGLAAGETSLGDVRPLAGRSYRLLLRDAFARAHVRQVLEDLGAEVRAPVDESPGTLLAGPNALICDPAAAEVIVPAAKTRESASLPQIWVLLTPEERRPLRDLLQKPVTGYLLRPVRRSTLAERLARADAESLKDTTRRMRTPALPAPAARAFRVLLADDTPVNAFIARTLLERRGHSVTVVDSGAKVLAALAGAQHFDILLLDMEMPGMSGPETAVAIRAQEQESGATRLPILALTANTHPEAVAHCIASGMDGHLAKPFDHHDLEEALSRLARRSAA